MLLKKIFKPKKLPVVLQTEIIECGHACLTMILQYHGYEIDLSTLRRIFPTSLKGINMANLTNMAQYFQFTTRVLRLELEQLDSLQTPAILHWDMNHFVVLKKVRGRTVIIHDPAQGELILDLSEVSKHFTGIAFELEPLESKTEKIYGEIKKLSSLELIKNVPQFGLTLAKIIFLAFILQGFTLIAPKYFQIVIDRVVVQSNIQLLYLLAGGFIGLKLMEIFFSMLRSFTVIYLNNRMNLKIGSRIFQHLMRLPLSYFEKRHLGDIMSRFGSIENIRQIVTSGFIEGGLSGLMAIFTLVMMLSYSLKMSLIVITSITIYFGLRLAFFMRLKRANEEMLKSQAVQSSNFMENIRGIQPIKIFHKEHDRITLWKNKYVDFLNSSLKVSKQNIFFGNARGIVFGIELILVVMFGAILIINKQLTIGMLYAFLFYRSMFTDSVGGLLERFIDYRMLSLYLDRLADILLRDTETVAPKDSKMEAPNIIIRDGALECKNLWFRYSDTEPDVITNASFKVDNGEFVVITGPSGCGKTTLLKLMLGLLEPNSGEILIDKKSINNIGIGTYRKNVAAVMQEDQLFAGSIAENISFFDPASDHAKVLKCAKLAGVDADILAMPMQFYTLVGDMGSTLSGGQKQRILLARALYADPKILFLDEATSHLDLLKESEINKAIVALGITRIVIAHRKETISLANRIIYLPEIMKHQL